MELKRRHWENLPKRLNVFTVRNATMRDLDTGKIIQYYSANTRLTVTQKTVDESGTYYRTDSAARNDLDWAFEASAFGLPNEKAPLAPASKTSPNSPKPVHSHTLPAQKKQKPTQKPTASKNGGGSKVKTFWKRLFKR